MVWRTDLPVKPLFEEKKIALWKEAQHCYEPPQKPHLLAQQEQCELEQSSHLEFLDTLLVLPQNMVQLQVLNGAG